MADAPSVAVDTHGDAYYSCALPAGYVAQPIVTTPSPNDAQPLLQVGKGLHTRQSQNIIYLDFAGYDLTGTRWNEASGSRAAVDTYHCLPFDADGDATTFNAGERNIQLVTWMAVADHFKAFDVDVTLDRPDVFTDHTLHVIITRSQDANGQANPGGAAYAVSYLGMFGASNSGTATPALVYFDRLGDQNSVASAILHVIGHSLGMTHMGTSTAECYAGHPDGTGRPWIPIMGAPFSGSSIIYPTWTKGEYYDASNTQDELALIATGFGALVDDNDGTANPPAALPVRGYTVQFSGTIETPDDIDKYRFTTLYPTFVSFSIYASSFYGYAPRVDLLDTNGNVVSTSFSHQWTGSVYAYIPAGIYDLRIRGAAVGDPLASSPTGFTSYSGTAGYSISSSIYALAPQAPIVSLPAAPVSTTTNTPVTLYPTATGTPYPTFQWQHRAHGQTTWEGVVDSAAYGVAVDSLVIREPSPVIDGDEFRCVATNSAGTTTSNSVTVSVAGAPGIAVPLRSQTVLVGAALQFQVTTASADSVSYAWTHDGQTIPGANSSSYSIANASLSDSGRYEVTVTNSSGTASSQCFVRVVPQKLAVIAWGDNTTNQGVVPAGMGNVVQVAVGSRHAIALNSDGSVFGWGDDTFHQTDVPAGLTGVVQVAAGNQFSAALKSDGTVVVWGGDHWSSSVPTYLVPSQGLSDVVSISAGSDGIVAVRSSGKLWMWGGVMYSGVDTTNASFTAVATGGDAMLALKRDGTVAGYGYGLAATVPNGLTGVTQLASGMSHGLALKGDGSVVAWGRNYSGESTVPTGLTGVVGITAGGTHSAALRSDGTVVEWGTVNNTAVSAPGAAANAFAIVASPLFDAALVPAVAPAILAAPVGQTVNVGTSTSLHVSTSGTGPFVYQWKKGGVALSDNSTYAGTQTDTLFLASPQSGDSGSYTVDVTNVAGSVTSAAAIISFVVPSTFTSVPLSSQVTEGQSTSFSVAMGDGGPFTYVWKHDRKTIVSATAATLALDSVTSTDAGYYEVIVTNAAGGVSHTTFSLAVAIPSPSLQVWDNYATTPPSLTDAVSAISSGLASFALRADGTLTAWGTYGGQPVTAPSGLTNVVGFSVSDYGHSMAVRADGTVYEWTFGYAAAPTPPQGLANVVAVAAGDSHALALRADGTVVAWGNNGSGQATVPAGLSDVVAIAARGATSVALTADGRVVVWGDRTGTVPNDLTDVVAIAAGSTHFVTLIANGTVRSWGSDYNGSTIVPSGLADVVGVAAGENTSFALKADGTLVGWGTNYWGQVSVPNTLGGVVGIAAGSSSPLALARKIVPSIVAQPGSATSTVGDYVVFTAGARGTPPLTYRWSHNGVGMSDSANVTGTTGATLVISEAQLADAGNYQVLVTDASGAVQSTSATLSVLQPPVFTVRPLNQVIRIGDQATFSCSTTSNSAVQYQWRHNGKLVSGVSGTSLTLNSATLADGGRYEVIATNAEASALSVFNVLVVSCSSTNLTALPWGEGNPLGGCRVPLGLSHVSQVSAGQYNGAAVLTNGAIQVWGYNNMGETNIPSDLGPAVQVAVGNEYVLVLTADGRVHRLGNVPVVWEPPVPPGLRNVVYVAANDYANVAVHSDGTVTTWGFPAAPDAVTNVVSVALGGRRAVAVSTDGSLTSWAISNVASVANPSGSGSPAGVAIGTDFDVRLNSDGTLSASGNDVGQAVASSGISDAIAVGAGTAHAVVLRTDGSGIGWGRNNEGQSAPLPADLHAQSVVSADFYNLVLVPIVPPAVSSSPSNSMVIAGRTATFTVGVSGTSVAYQWFKDGQPLSDGNGIVGATSSKLRIVNAQTSSTGTYTVKATNGAGEVQVGATLSVAVPPAFATRPLSQIVQLGSDTTFTATPASSTGYTYEWRHNGQLISGATSATLTLRAVTWQSAGSYEVTMSDGVGFNRSVAWLYISPVPTTGLTAVTWSNGQYAEQSLGNNTSPLVAVSAGRDTSLLIQSDGHVQLWGLFPGYTPPSGVVAAACADIRALLLHSDGTVQSIGYFGGSDSAVTASLFDVIGVAATNDENFALLRDGTVMHWPFITTNDPSVVPGFTNIVKIVGGSSRLLGLKSDGTVLVFDGTATSTLLASTDNIDVAAGQQSVVALKSGGAVSQSTDNATSDGSVPGGLPSIVEISACFHHAQALDATGTLHAWGTTFNQVNSTPPADLAGHVAACVAGAYHDVALVAPPITPTAVTAAPSAVSVTSGHNASFTVSASGTGPLQYQWQKSSDGGTTWLDMSDGSHVTGSQQATLTITSPTLASNGVQVRCRVSGSGGTQTSAAATLTVRPAVAGDFDGDGQPDLLWQNQSTGQRVVWFMDGAHQKGAYVDVGIPGLNWQSVGLEWRIVAMADFDGDGKTDLLWQNTATGQCGFWLLDGTTLAGGFVSLTTVSLDWRIAGAADFNGDGHPDVVLQNTKTGQCGFWLMNGTAITGNFVPLITVSTDWNIAAVGDFDGDGHPDLVVENVVTGQRGFWLLNGTQLAHDYVPLATIPKEWRIAGAADYNGDGKPDLVWQNTVTGQRGFWMMNGTALQGGFVNLNAISPVWSLNGTPCGKPPEITATSGAVSVSVGGSFTLSVSTTSTTSSDLSYQWYKGGTPIDGATHAIYSVSHAQLADAGAYAVSVSNVFGSTQTGAANVTVSAGTPADFDGDGKPDLVWQNAVTGQRVLWLMNGTTQKGSYIDLGTIPTEWRIAAMGDFNGDQQTDLVWENTKTGQRGLWLMNGSHLQGNFVPLITVSTDWSVVGAADFNGDGNTDLVLQNTKTGQRGFWLMNQTTITSFVPLITVSADWTIVGTGDFNGDNKPDLAIENTKTGEHGLWLLNGTALAGGYISWGNIQTDTRVVAVGDYSGDGRPDVIWQNRTTGVVSMWQMDGTTFSGQSAYIATLPLEWRAGAASADVSAPPTIVQQPQSTQARAGTSVTLSVSASGTGTLTYSWNKNGTPVAGATSATLAINKAEWPDAGDYTVSVTNSAGTITSASATLKVLPRVTSDLDGDSKADLIWRNRRTGQAVVWLLNGTSQKGAYIDLATVSSSWRIAAVADFNGDGQNDILWENTVTGQRGFWLMNGTRLQGDFVPLITVPIEWTIVGAADFNGDGSPDIVLQNMRTGQRGFWLMNGTAISGNFVPLYTVSVDWDIVAVGDFNGDGKPDLVLENSLTGQRGLWLMNGTSLLQDYVPLATIPVEWRIAGAADYDGDGKADLLWENSVTGRRGFWLMDGATLKGNFVDLVTLSTDWTLSDR